MIYIFPTALFYEIFGSQGRDFYQTGKRQILTVAMKSIDLKKQLVLHIYSKWRK